MAVKIMQKKISRAYWTSGDTGPDDMDHRASLCNFFFLLAR
jgi:hypothetical protein